MGFLVLNVAHDGRDIRGAHAEGRVALLPCEWKAFLVCPSGGIRFDGVDGFGERQSGQDFDEEMNVIVHATDGVDENFVVLADAGRVGPEARLKIFRDEFGAVFGVEDNMDGVLGVRVRHVSRLRCFKLLYITDPALTRWATL